METNDVVVKPGIWSHYTGAHFEVIGVAIGSYLYGEAVIYRGLGSGQLYYRAVSDFLSEEMIDGTLVPKFVWLTDSNQA